MKNQGRGKGRRFQEGQSGNPHGRPKGTVNKATGEAKAFCSSIVDSAYRMEFRRRALKGILSPVIEVMLWHYAKGKPPHHVKHSGGIIRLDPEKLKGLSDEHLEQLAAGCRLAHHLLHDAS